MEMMLPLNIILLCLFLVENWSGDVDATLALRRTDKSSCRRKVLKKCPCTTVNPCEFNYKSKASDATNKNNILTEDDVRNNIRTELPTDLNLSGRRFEGIDKNAFDNFTNLTSLNLDHNKLTNLPPFVFSKLTNLKHLSIADNNLRGTKNVFAGLSNLEYLNLSGNPLTEILEDNCFAGLTNSCEILMRGVNGVKSIGANAFGSGSSTPLQDFTNKLTNNTEPKPKLLHARSAQFDSGPSFWNPANEYFAVQICIQENSVQRLDLLKMDENPTSGCREVEFKYRTLFLTSLGVSKFEKGWYRLQDRKQLSNTLSAIQLTGNDIVRVTSDVVNDLPEYITWLELDDNKIERLENETFVHQKIFSLSLTNNLIGEIEDNTFKMPNLYQLYLQGNRLKDTKFATTLPLSLVSLYLDRNEIIEISANSFAKLKNLSYLNLSGNKITTVQSLALRGATGIHQLLLSDNKIVTVEPGAFEDLLVFQIFLDGNEISSFQKGVFTGLGNIWQLNVAKNSLTKIECDTFELPSLNILNMRDNNITLIEKGALKILSNLEDLNISQNPIKRLENGALFGMNKTSNARVNVEGTPLEVIQGGLFDDV